MQISSAKSDFWDVLDANDLDIPRGDAKGSHVNKPNQQATRSFEN